MRQWHNVQQNSEEWYNLRLGKITSSNFDKICANMGKAFGEPAKKYARQKALERVTGKLDETAQFSNSYMDRGHELEPLALELYQMQTFNEVTNGGFFSISAFGDSPDGLVGSSGCVEVKSVIPNTHWKVIERGGYDTSYKWQIQGHMYIGDKQWCDFVSYCPEFAKGKELYVFRVERDDEMQDQLKDRLEAFESLVKEKQRLIAA